jgi:hypothetical protein
MSAIALKAWLPPPTSSAVPAATQKNKHDEDDDEKCRGVHVALPLEPLKQDTLFSKCQEKLPQPARYLRREWEFIGAATAEQTQCCHNQAKAGLHFAFGALAGASHFIPAFSQAD